MSTDYYSMALALPTHVIPAEVQTIEDMGRLWQPDNGLMSASRNNWLCVALWKTLLHFRAKPLIFLSRSSAILEMAEVREARDCLTEVIQGLRTHPNALVDILQQTAWSEAILIQLLNESYSPWGLVPSIDDGDDIPYLISFLLKLRGLLEHADAERLGVVYFQDYAHFENRIALEL